MRRVDLQQQLIAVGGTAVTVTSAIPINTIRSIYKLKASEKSGSPNTLYIDGLLGTTVTAVDRLKLAGSEVQDWPDEALKEDSLPIWRFEQASFDHIQLTAYAATVDVLIQFSDEHA